jgi:hypothetical protein
MIDIIPPIPSLWAILAVVATVVLWKRNNTLPALGTGALSAFLLAGWAMSAVAWGVGVLVLGAVVTTGVIVARKATGRTALPSRNKDQNSLPAGETTDFDMMMRDIRTNAAKAAVPVANRLRNR